MEEIPPYTDCEVDTNQISPEKILGFGFFMDFFFCFIWDTGEAGRETSVVDAGRLSAPSRSIEYGKGWRLLVAF